MKKIIIPIIAIVATLASCQKDLKVLKLEMEHFDANGEKLHLNGDNYACWDNGDKVAVNGISKSITVGDDKNTATIAVEQDGPYYAFAPAGSMKNYNNGIYQFTYPAKISLTKNPSKLTFDAPMYATSTEDNTLVFKNQGAVLDLVISAASDPVYTGKILSIEVTVAGGILSGTFSTSTEGATYVAEANDATDSIKIVYATSKTATKGNPQTINGITNKHFQIPIPVTTGTSLRVEVTTEDGQYTFEKETPVNFERSKIYTIPCDLRNTTFIEDPEIRYMATSGSKIPFTDIVWSSSFTQTKAGSDYIMTFSNTITEIPQNAFNVGSLQEITLPGTITTIGADAFNGCTKLKWIKLKSLTPPTLGNETVFYNIGTDPNYGPTKLYVPAPSVAAYKAAWGTNGTIGHYFDDDNIKAL